MNTVYVSREYFSDDKTRDTFRCAISTEMA